MIDFSLSLEISIHFSHFSFLDIVLFDIYVDSAISGHCN